jgi:pyruvate dehydrogenase E2 component (dihydrolipoamide acetyltransferase)
VAASPDAAAPAVGERRVLAAPFVRKLARDLGVRLEDVPGSGPQGRVRSADVEAFARRMKPAPANRSDDAGERVPLAGLRKRIAEHMVEAVRHAPHVTAFDQFDVTDLVRLRRDLAVRAEADGVRLTYLPFVVKAAVEALRAVPTANAVLDEAAQEIVLRRAYHVGIATAVPGGLLVPVVRHAERRSIPEIAVEIARLAAAARTRQSPPEDLAGGTFTITSYGGMQGGVLFATPILNYPEVAILGVGRIEEQPRVVDGQVVPRHCLGVSFTFDHRVLDGEGAGTFLATLRRYLERPTDLLLRLR